MSRLQGERVEESVGCGDVGTKVARGGQAVMFKGAQVQEGLGRVVSAQSASSHVKPGHGLSVSVCLRRDVTMATLGCRLLYARRPRGAAQHIPTRHPRPALVLRRGGERAVCASGTLPLDGSGVAHRTARDAQTARAGIVL